MNLLPSFLRRKAAPAGSLTHPGGSGSPVFFRSLSIEDGTGRGAYNYRRRVGTGRDASVVMAPVQWIQRSFTEAPLVIDQEVKGGEWEPDEGHPLQALLEVPNPFYDAVHMQQAALFSYCTDGNAYLLTVPDRLNRPAQLWYAPHWLMEPTSPDDGSEFLTGYWYTAGGERTFLPPERVVHFRHGVDPNNLRKGISPLDSALREIWVDMEAAEFVAALLRNQGIPGVIVTPKGDVQSQSIDVDAVKKYLMERFTGSHRGEPMVFKAPTEVTKLGWSPSELDLTPASDRSEERVCALLGIPAAVVGFSAGLETTKVGATMKAFLEQAWLNGIIPVQRNFASEFSRRLLPLYGQQGARRRVRYDRSDVAALQEDLNEKAKRVTVMVDSGILSVAEAKREMGIEPGPADEVYLRRITTIAVPVGQVQAPLPPPVDQGVRAAKEAARKADEPTGFEQRLLDTAPRADATAAQIRFIEHQERAAPILAGVMAVELRDFFTATLGARAEQAANAVLGDIFKQAPEHSIAADRVMEAMNMPGITPVFQEVYERHYLRVATESTADAMDIIGLATDIPDPVARSIIVTGGTRSGLVDLTAQTRTAVLQAIEEGRALGEGVDALAKRIAEIVPKGPWSSAEVRARVIARTETKHAQRVSAIEMAKGQGVDRFRVFDGRLGATDATCAQMDGLIVSAADADQLAGDEHPNGTRDFVPYFGTEATE